MNFVGTGKRLSQGDIGDAARMIGIETAVLLAFLEVEAGGRGFDNQNRPKMLFEPHIFYRELKSNPTLQMKAVNAGLAYKNWKPGAYPADSYPRIKQAMKISHVSALRSASWGLPQILGGNCEASGFSNSEIMVQTMMQGEREQLLAMVTLMKSWGMVKMLTGKDFTKPDSWRDAAKKYNGPAYDRNGYHTRLASAYRKHSLGQKMTVPTTALVLRPGMKGEAVRNLQNDLAALGYVFKAGIDGRYGPETQKIVGQFQRERGLASDGIAGSKTLDALAKSIAINKEDKSPSAPVWPQQQNKSSLLERFLEWLF